MRSVQHLMRVHFLLLSLMALIATRRAGVRPAVRATDLRS
jgi:hypothetical protein